jgi:hypothetical protein
MILIIDEIVNAHPEATVVVSGMIIDWYDIPERIRREGAADWWKHYTEGFTGFMRSSCMVRPLQSANAPELPSTVAARKLYPDIVQREQDYLAWQGSTTHYWGDQPIPVVDALAPALEDPSLSPYKYGFLVTIGYPRDLCVVTIILPDGHILLNLISLIAYLDINTVQDRGLALDETHFLHPVVPRNDGKKDNTTYKYAPRLTNLLLPPSTTPDDLNALIGRDEGLMETLFFGDDRWKAAKSQTLLLHDQSPMFEYFKLSQGPHYEVGVPASPLYHIAVLTGTSVMISQRGVTDFRNEEIQYEQQLEQQIRSQRNLVWRAFNLILVDILRLGLFVAPGIPGWVKAPVNFWLTELGDKSLNKP